MNFPKNVFIAAIIAPAPIVPPSTLCDVYIPIESDSESATATATIPATTAKRDAVAALSPTTMPRVVRTAEEIPKLNRPN